MHHALRLLPIFPALLTLAAGHLHAQTVYPATLAGHAVLPAKTFITAPKDAPADL
jgi:hypothetical protein